MADSTDPDTPASTGGWVPDGWDLPTPRSPRPSGSGGGGSRGRQRPAPSDWCGISTLRMAGLVQFAQSIAWVVGCGLALAVAYAYSVQGDYGDQSGRASGPG